MDGCPSRLGQEFELPSVNRLILVERHRADRVSVLASVVDMLDLHIVFDVLASIDRCAECDRALL